MGYARGGDIFGDVARAMLEEDLPDDVLDRVLYRLAVSLTDAGWDTVDESIAEFYRYPVVQHALRKANGDQYLSGPDGRVDAYIQFVGDLNGGEWVLTILPSTMGSHTEAGTIDGFNALIDRWAEAGGPSYRRAALDFKLL